VLFILEAGVSSESALLELAVFSEVDNFLPSLREKLLPFYTVKFILLEGWQTLRFGWNVT